MESFRKKPGVFMLWTITVLLILGLGIWGCIAIGTHHGMKLYDLGKFNGVEYAYGNDMQSEYGLYKKSGNGYVRITENPPDGQKSMHLSGNTLIYTGSGRLMFVDTQTDVVVDYGSSLNVLGVTSKYVVGSNLSEGNLTVVDISTKSVYDVQSVFPMDGATCDEKKVVFRDRANEKRFAYYFADKHIEPVADH